MNSDDLNALNDLLTRNSFSKVLEGIYTQAALKGKTLVTYAGGDFTALASKLYHLYRGTPV